MVFATAGLAFSITGLVMVIHRGTEAASRVLAPDPVCEGLAVPPFSLMDQDGRPATQAMLQGRVTVLDFIFTNCPFVCPGMTMAMSDLAAGLSGTPVRFMSISVDPRHDTPERLREFASGHGVDLGRWSFLTGDPAVIEAIVRGSLQFELQADAARTVGLPDGSTMQNIVHPGKLILVGPDLGVLGIYDPNRPEEMELLKRRARLGAAAAEKPRS